jgi:serine/threonine-protein kinase
VIEIGSVVNGKYRIVRVLGDGGMGTVYEALHTVLGTRVAVKVLHPELMGRPGLVERFLQEARVAAQIRSPHVVQVTDVDRTADGHAFIVMEVLEGTPLSAALERERKFPVSVACDYALQILQALEAAHALGVIHRDLKPENVFVTLPGGKPVLKLIDFGIAKAKRAEASERQLTIAGVVMGTPEYMAPEQAYSSTDVDARADVYAVGVMLYELLSGVRPVNGDDARVIALRVERGDVVPLLRVAPETPRELAGLVHRAMAARRELRFATATEMRVALETILSGRRTPEGQHTTMRAPPIVTVLAPHPPVAGVMPAWTPAVAPTPMRRRSRTGGAVFVICLLVGAAAVVVAVVALTGTATTAPPVPSLRDPAPTALPSAVAVAPAASPSEAEQGAPAVPRLVPTRAPPVAPRTQPRSTAVATPDAAPPPLLFPSAFPSAIGGIPTTLPGVLALPSSLPIALPSAIPSALPTSVPSGVPTWPPGSSAPPDPSSSGGPGY